MTTIHVQIRKHSPIYVVVALLMQLAIGCAANQAPARQDAGAADAGEADAGEADASQVDGGPADGSALDSGAMDASTSTDATVAEDARMDAASDADIDGGVAIHDSGTDTGITSVGTGEYMAFYLKDGIIYAVGATAGLSGQGAYDGLVIPPRPIVTPEGLRFVDVRGGRHQSMALDVNGHVWTWGSGETTLDPTFDGLQGSGADAGDERYPYMITEDINGQPFDHVIGIQPSMRTNAAWKDDGTLWIWGDCTGGTLGDGTNSGFVRKPTRVQIPLASGAKIIKVRGANGMLALADDGTVWAWGPAESNMDGTGASDLTRPHQVQGLPSDIRDISMGYASFYYALTSTGELYGWGARGSYLGLGSDGHEYNPTPTAISLTSVLGLPHPVVAVEAMHMTTHVILSDGTLWGWGDTPDGELGNGQGLDFSTYHTPYNFDLGAFELLVRHPVQIAPGVSNFTKIFSNAPYLFYAYAQTADGSLYSWGKNKNGLLGNGVYPWPAGGSVGVASNMAAAYPDSWNVLTATLVTPFETAPIPTNSPYCVANPHATACE